ncbi:NAD-dependent epimerase/dehydratase family protein [Marinobacter sp. NFXS9]|uniref:NAD-dependent epimerase/dehydratase family protein n=1 Tax=Marinobacter sp. NFXS9 TaxID=2818433 RepID=UPI0032DEA8C8
MTRIAVTGANGFIGRALITELLKIPRIRVVAVSRNPDSVPLHANISVCSWDKCLSESSHEDHPLVNCDCVIHLAGLAHASAVDANDAPDVYRLVNVDGTRLLARRAVESKVRRFIFVSSIKVNGENTKPGQPFSADSEPCPEDEYGRSKLDAELALQEIGQASDLEFTIIRPVLVYGVDVKANFRELMIWAIRGVPLPFKSISNKRSFIALDNLIDLIIHCLDHPAAANQVFLASDGEDLSTPELIKRLAEAAGRPARLFPVPIGLLGLLARLTGRGSVMKRLAGSLQVDGQETRRRLGWNPPLLIDQALREAAEAYLNEINGKGGSK